MKYLQEQSHKRLNILTNEWVLVSPHRTKRPWQGKEEKTDTTDSISYDANCYLCPGNTRANGAVNPDYKDVYVFDNDFAALNNTAKKNTYNIAPQGIASPSPYKTTHDFVFMSIFVRIPTTKI